MFARDEVEFVHQNFLHRFALCALADAGEKLLGELETLLLHHFEGEEGGQGLHSIVSEGAAHRMPNLQHLFDEHREFLTRLDELQTATAAALAGPVKEISEGIHRLAESLRRHEAEEERLFGEAFYTDLGGRSS